MQEDVVGIPSSQLCLIRPWLITSDTVRTARSHSGSLKGEIEDPWDVSCLPYILPLRLERVLLGSVLSAILFFCSCSPLVGLIALALALSMVTDF